MRFYSSVRSIWWFFSGYPADRIARLLNISEHWPREKIEEFRNNKIRKLISHCYENVPYYRRMMDEYQINPKDIKTAEGLKNLPILTKDIIRSNHRELLAKNIDTMRTSWIKTGGTTGEPLRVCKDLQCRTWASMCFERELRWGGVGVDDPKTKLFGGSLGLDKADFSTRMGSWLRGDVFLPAFELRADTALTYFKTIRRSKSRVLLGYPSAMFRLATLAEEMHQNIEFDVVFPTAELMLPEWKETIHKVFKCPVIPYYGCREIYSLGSHALDSDAYIIPEEHVVIEIMKNNSTTHLEGEGRFLITDLDNYAMPLIRYVNGDTGKISPHSGHYPFNRIERIDGRSNSFLMTENGEMISGVISTRVFANVQSVKQFQIIQEEPLRIVIRIVQKYNVTENDKNFIIELMTKYLGKKMKIYIEEVSDIPTPSSGKNTFVINKCIQS